MPFMTRKDLGIITVATREVLLTEYSADSCIASSLVGQKVLAHYGVTARPVATTVAAYNRRGREMFNSGLPFTQWPRDAWSVGVQGSGVMNFETKRYDGHVVLLFKPAGSPRTLLDLSADQLDRPLKSLRVPGPVAVEMPRLWTPMDPAEITIDGPSATYIAYRPLLGGDDWRLAKDGQDHDRHERLATAAIALCDKRLSAVRV
jgi:hypothetical protein